MPTPIVTFNKYLLDDVETSISAYTQTIASGTFTASGSEYIDDKYVYSFIVKPFESTTTTVQTHKLIFDMDVNGDTEGSYFAPFSHAGAVEPHSASGTYDDTRYGGVTNDAVDITTWTVGQTSGTTTINPDSGFEGQGAMAEYFASGTLPNSGTVWSATFGSSGSAVLDVPTIYYGSYVAHTDPTVWDGAGALHDWQMFQVHVGHQVEIANLSPDTAWASGTHQNDNINIYKDSKAGTLYLNVKTYHEHPINWELFDDTPTLVDSGTQSGSFVEDQWLFIDNLDLGTGSGTYELKLYASGVITYPTPLRTMQITIYSDLLNRFGVGRFGLARFGLP